MLFGVAVSKMRWMLILLSLILLSSLAIYRFLGSNIKVAGITDMHRVEQIASKLRTILQNTKNNIDRSHIQSLLTDVTSMLSPGQPAAVDDFVSLATPINGDVCPEQFIFSKMNGDYPMFRKGFELMKCDDAPPFDTILTIALNFVGYSEEDLRMADKMFSYLAEVHSSMKVVVAVSNEQHRKRFASERVRVTRVSDSRTQASVWKQLLSAVDTKYVFVGRDVVYLTPHIRFERLVREISGLGVWFVASAARTLEGKWRNGCEQVVLRNASLVYESGYEHSAHECLYCHYSDFPFVALTASFDQFPLPEHHSCVSAFRSWFLELQRQSLTGIACPDSMAFVRDSTSDSTIKSSFLDLAKMFEVEMIKLPSGVVHTFTCAEAGTTCAVFKNAPGVALSHCCLKELSDLIKFIMQTCKSASIMCELQEGTLLGAAKFGALLPWEKDADVGLLEANFTSFLALEPSITKQGYRFTPTGTSYITIYSQHWFLEIFPQPILDSVELMNEGLSPTVVYLDGAWLAAPASPGRTVQNRYGRNLYKHILHWRDTGGVTSWQNYSLKSFPPCPRPGHHACLDQYLVDGNTQFREPRV